MPGATTHGHAHGEAYMLMAYQCVGGRGVRGCDRTEVIWNSRDGVTPFMIRCRHCRGEAQHTDWNADQYRPDHVPAVGDRIFVDLDPEEALRKRRDYVEQWWDHPDMPMRDHDVLGPLGKDGAAAKLAEGDMREFAGGTPHLIEVTDPVCSWLARRGGGR